jgi:adenylate cyclase
MGKVNEWARSQGLPDLAMGIGIHTGEAVLGNIGSKLRTKYDMIGRNVNLASRIEGYCKGGQILISSETLEAAGDQVILNPAGELLVRPKGISEDIPLHDVIGFGTNLLR